MKCEMLFKPFWALDESSRWSPVREYEDKNEDEDADEVDAQLGEEGDLICVLLSLAN